MLPPEALGEKLFHAFLLASLQLLTFPGWEMSKVCPTFTFLPVCLRLCFLFL